MRSLSTGGCPYDNAVAEATFKLFKIEFVKRRHFDCLDDFTTNYMTMYIGLTTFVFIGLLATRVLLINKMEHHKKAV